MMDKKAKFDEIISTVGKTTKSIIDTTIQVVDQNDDGKFDLSDVAVITETVGNSAQKGAQIMKDNINEQKRNLELKRLQPIFSETLAAADFFMPKLIRIVERDKRYVESEVCQGSIGYNSNPKDLPVVNIFTDSVNAFGVDFYPDNTYEFYYADPCERDRYIALDEYFGYMKVARINELQKIAQYLGAKYFKVTYKEKKTSFSDKKIKVQGKASKLTSVEAERHLSENECSAIDVMAEIECMGHEPDIPALRYLQRDPSVQSLIDLRMNTKGPLKRQKYTINFSHTSCLKESDAVKIDAVLKELKCTGNSTVTSEAKNESRRNFEYEIEF